jgi:hypothetical protein
MSNEEDTSSEPRDDTSLDTDNQVTRDAKWRSEIDRIAAEAIRNYEALVEQAAKACPPSPPPSASFLAREHLGRPWCTAWRRFEADMLQIGLRIHEAETPDGHGGPAVAVPRAVFPAVVRATTVKLESHEVDDLIVAYPATLRV